MQERILVMKKRQIILISAVCAVIAVIISLTCIYRSYVMPKHIEPVLEQVAVAVNDEDMQADLLEYAARLLDEGILSEETVQQYISRYDMPEDRDTKTVSRPESKSDSENRVRDDNEDKNTQNDAVNWAHEKLGIATVKVNDSKTDENKYSYSARAKRSIATSAEDVKDTEDDEKTVSEDSSLYDRIKSNMTASDLSAAYRLSSKIDIPYIKSVFTNKREVRSYLSAALTEKDIAKAMELYLKYAYLLSD